MKRLFLLLLVASSPLLGQSSRLGSYHVALTPHGGARQAGETNSLEVVMRDRAQHELFRFFRGIPYDVPFPSAAVFETGRLVLIHAFDGTLEFFDQSGQPIRNLRLPEDAGPDYERIIAVAAHDSMAALLLSEPGRENAMVAVVTDRGEMVFSRDVAAANASGIVLSHNGKITAAGVYRWSDSGVLEQTYFLSTSGELLGSVDAGCIAGEFSPDDAQFLGLTKRRMSVVSIATRTVTATLTADEGTILLDGTWNGSRAVVLSANIPALRSGAWVYTHPLLRQVDSDGTVKLLQEIPSAEFISASLERLGTQVFLKVEGP